MADRAGRPGGLQPAPDGYPIKLVRDRTAAIVNPSGEPGSLWYGGAQKSDYVRLLRLKLAEEVGEFLVDGSVAELQDVQAVIDALVRAQGMTADEFRARVDADPRGGFFDGIIMLGRHGEYDRA